MPENREAKSDDASEARTDVEQGERSAESAPSPEEALDLDGMDLTVESVEERISPSETNVFDK